VKKVEKRREQAKSGGVAAHVIRCRESGEKNTPREKRTKRRDMVMRVGEKFLFVGNDETALGTTWTGERAGSQSDGEGGRGPGTAGKRFVTSVEESELVKRKRRVVIFAIPEGIKKLFMSITG